MRFTRLRKSRRMRTNAAESKKNANKWYRCSSAT